MEERRRQVGHGRRLKAAALSVTLAAAGVVVAQQLAPSAGATSYGPAQIGTQNTGWEASSITQAGRGIGGRGVGLAPGVADGVAGAKVGRLVGRAVDKAGIRPRSSRGRSARPGPDSSRGAMSDPADGGPAAPSWAAPASAIVRATRANSTINLFYRRFYENFN